MLLFASFGVILSVIWKVILAILILLFMITVHEFGHYVAGKLLGFQINEFAIGMGPKIFRKQLKSGEFFSIRVFPLGGYCAFEGEDEENQDANPKAFNNQKPWKRIIVLINGALFNFISAVIISLVAFACFPETVLVVDSVFDDSKNASAFNTQVGFNEGDIIYSIDGKKLYLTVDSSAYIEKADDTMQVIVLRKNDQGKFNKVELTINKGDYTYVDDGNIGHGYGWGILQRYEKHTFGFAESLNRSLPYCARTGAYILETLGGIFTGRVGLTDLGGPITTIDVTTQIISTGFANTLFLIIMISVNLAVFNLLPLPALDGGRVVFVLIEMITKKPVKRKTEGIIHAIGLIFLLALVVFLDIVRYVL